MNRFVTLIALSISLSPAFGSGLKQLVSVRCEDKLAEFAPWPKVISNEASRKGVIGAMRRDLIALSNQEETIDIWSAGRGSLLEVLRGHSSKVQHVQFHPTRSILASAAGNELRIWYHPRMGETKSLAVDIGDSVTSLGFSSSGRLLIGTQGGLVKIAALDIRTESKEEVQRTQLEIDGKKVNWVETQEVQVADLSLSWLYEITHGTDKPIRFVEVDENDKMILSASDHEAAVWQLKDDAREIVRLEREDRITAISLSGTGEVFAVGHDDGLVAVYDLLYQRVTQEFSAAEDKPVKGLLLKNDNIHLLVAVPGVQRIYLLEESGATHLFDVRQDHHELDPPLLGSRPGLL